MISWEKRECEYNHTHVDVTTASSHSASCSWACGGVLWSGHLCNDHMAVARTVWPGIFSAQLLERHPQPRATPHPHEHGHSIQRAGQDNDAHRAPRSTAHPALAQVALRHAARTRNPYQLPLPSYLQSRLSTSGGGRIQETSSHVGDSRHTETHSHTQSHRLRRTCNSGITRYVSSISGCDTSDSSFYTPWYGICECTASVNVLPSRCSWRSHTRCIVGTRAMAPSQSPPRSCCPVPHMHAPRSCCGACMAAECATAGGAAALGCPRCDCQTYEAYAYVLNDFARKRETRAASIRNSRAPPACMRQAAPPTAPLCAMADPTACGPCLCRRYVEISESVGPWSCRSCGMRMRPQWP